ncbi:alpha/beta hydrolase [Arthrobacter sp. zg-Y40]|uniref:alpha/beta fold hydrolase n=1 Tax=unclassified Arthrobacter TaxID=235627 RepID=UPI001D149F81|nr:MULTISPECIES: alpha/beta fold hydrolase [unclassified Arthrobacter]MCC3276070.1 alpha/beta hydrolase [Arthrobacter sp. zg-Y20]MCC3277946.1 alpha/beta hydrolase [Arthrobacter sp. zg-Y40]MDK1316228.1 alpha/beta fold hydrolase [Arthrobacter sp. zg.Y20]WIB05493.1 alpha/beta fold hydrolase [Arthrobacter sp. zg-Y20]
MSIPAIKATRLTGPGAPVLIAGPSLGTAALPLWNRAAAALDTFTVIGWDLPGHGASPAAEDGFSIDDLAAAVADLVRGARRSGDIAAGVPVFYAGVSLGGAVGLQLGLDHGDLFDGLAVMCSGAKIGDAEGWEERADTVRAQGTPTQITGSAQRWFAPGFMEREPAAAAALLHSLQDADRFSYAYCCSALANFDVRERLPDITVPVLAVAGAEDAVTPPSFADLIADRVTNGTAAVVNEAAHLVPAEQPAQTAQLLKDFFGAQYLEGI